MHFRHGNASPWAVGISRALAPRYARLIDNLYASTTLQRKQDKIRPGGKHDAEPPRSLRTHFACRIIPIVLYLRPEHRRTGGQGAPEARPVHGGRWLPAGAVGQILRPLW